MFADGADRDGMLEMYRNPLIQGFTTNPTLMRKAGVSEYAAFARDVLNEIRDRPISFEVFADDFDEMERQALAIRSWSDNVYVKIPITNTKGESSSRLLRTLSRAGVKLNVTALMTVEQVRPFPNLELIWASPRELLNVFQAELVGCHVITATNDILKKLIQVGKDLDRLLLETVQMFYDDAVKAG